MKRANGCFLFPFALFWCTIVAIFDVFIFGTIAAQIASTQYASTRGTVISSEVKTSQDEDGTSYRAAIHYKYEAQGQTFQGHRISYLMMGGNASARRLVAQYPKGAPVTVYYCPYSPDQAVLERIYFSGYELLMALFITPFNLVGLILVGGVLGIPRPRHAKTGGVEVAATPFEIRVRLHASTPWLNAGGALLAGTFLGTFVAIPAALVLGPKAAGILMWLLVLGLSRWAYVAAQEKNACHYGDLIYLPSDKVLELWPLPLSGPQRYQASQLQAIQVTRETSKDSDGDDVHREVLDFTIDGQRIRLKEFTDLSEALALKHWLAEHIPVSAVVECDDEEVEDGDEDWTQGATSRR